MFAFILNILIIAVVMWLSFMEWNSLRSNVRWWTGADGGLVHASHNEKSVGAVVITGFDAFRTYYCPADSRYKYVSQRRMRVKVL